LVKALRIIITGLVQGVGFRPFIHRLVDKLGLKGYVKNIGGSEVEVWIEGSEDNVDMFMKLLYLEKPPPAIIEDVIVREEKPRGYKAFSIEPSGLETYMRSNIPPDLAMCRDCLREILDKNDRRYRYPFNSCAWCGPRFSYMYRVPYDRGNTAMSKYSLCEDCLREYRDIHDLRRYHAQGISCPRDGPVLKLYTIDWSFVETNDPISLAAKLIDEGYIVAVKGIGGFHIASLATDDDVVYKLRLRKKRPSKPFAIMGLDTRVLEKLVYIDDSDRALLESPEAPILLLPKKPDTPVSKHVSPGLSHEGVFIAYSPLHYLLLLETRDKFLIMTSGNIHGEPMCITDDCVREKLRNVVDYVLTHDREIVNRVDDSVLRKTAGQYVFLRRSRGYAPRWIRLGKDLGGEFIGFGADLGNVFAIGFEDKIVLSQYIGDLDNVSVQSDLLKYVEYLVKNYHIDLGKTVVMVDKHPQYHSRRIGYEYAEKYGLTIHEVQHHYAHLLGAAYEAGLDDDVAGLAIDGLGWGDDNTIWGGEVMVFNTGRNEYSRVGSLAPLPITGDRDTIYPSRILASILALHRYSLDEIMGIVGASDRDNPRSSEYELVIKLVERGRFIKASSTGRLLDVVSHILGVCSYRSYEGEPAINLEAHAYKHDSFVEIPGFKISSSDGLNVLEYFDALVWLINNREKFDTRDLAYSFQHLLGYWYGELMLNSVKGFSVNSTIVVSGGAAVNDIVVKGFMERVREEGFRVYIPRKIPLGDGGIGFGQVVAGSLLNNL